MSDGFDRFLSIGSTPDWISPLLGLIQDFTNGPRHTFYVARACGLSVNQIKGLLRRQGVKVWGDMIIDDMIVFSVRQPQARWADYILRREGVPILGQKQS